MKRSEVIEKLAEELASIDGVRFTGWYMDSYKDYAKEILDFIERKIKMSAPPIIFVEGNYWANIWEKE